MENVLAFLEPAMVTSPSAAIEDAVTALADQQIGVAAVLNNRRIVGIVTEHDLVRRAVAHGVEGSELTVADMMTRPVETVVESTSAIEALNVMRDKRIRHLAVVDAQGCYVGMLTLRRLAFELLDDLELKLDNVTRELMADGPGG
jgi:CBS domain-containing protein